MFLLLQRVVAPFMFAMIVPLNLTDGYFVVLLKSHYSYFPCSQWKCTGPTILATLKRVATLGWVYYSFLRWRCGANGNQVHALDLMELGQGDSGSPFRTSHECKFLTVSPTTTKASYHWWVPKSCLLRCSG